MVLWGGWTVLAWALAPGAADPWRALGLAGAAAVGVAVVLVRPDQRHVAAVVAVVTGGVVVWGYLGWVARGAAGTEMTGPFTLSNPFGAMAAVAVVLALVPACSPLPWPARGGAVLAAVVAGQALVRSGSMGSLIAVGFGVVVVVVGTWPRNAAAGRQGVAVPLVGAVALAALALGFGVTAAISSDPERAPDTGLGVDPENHVAEHFTIWAEAVSVWRGRPLTGVGPGALVEVTGDTPDARGDFLNALAETGIVAAVAWAAATACAAGAVVVVAAARRAPAAPAAALAATTAVLVAYSLVDTTAAWPVLAMVLCAGGASTVVAATPGPDVVRQTSGRR